ncbi:WhiB family transcriptional regulator [Rhodococcus rhodochrous]|uniref:WhiB family transcriptional regulator n=1 Tax=Rhodococcus rhodochrous TaxID=1829 RepID=UPI0036F23576
MRYDNHSPRDRWTSRAACLFFGPTLFFGPDHETRGQRQRREREAKMICSTCAVCSACRQFAFATRERYGVWGGTSERERSVLRFLDLSPTT